MREAVLVTGGSGFIAAHCIAQLLGTGYRVRTTVRSLSSGADALVATAESLVRLGVLRDSKKAA
jgi:dihydroflavonol-4-reductase